MDFRITNIKLSIKCQGVCLSSVLKQAAELNLKTKVFANYIVLKSQFTYIIFKANSYKENRTNHINVTKINSFEKVDTACQFLQDLQEGLLIISSKIDNITVSYDFKQSFCLHATAISLSSVCLTTLNTETFPGLFLKFKNGYGTAILFHTGKCVLLGCKDTTQIEYILKIIHEKSQKW